MLLFDIFLFPMAAIACPIGHREGAAGWQAGRGPQFLISKVGGKRGNLERMYTSSNVT